MKKSSCPSGRRGGGVHRISSDEDDRTIFSGLKFLIPGFFWEENLASSFLGGLI